jgi:hypothetical protein
MLRIYAKVETCDWTGTFYTQAIGAHLSPRGSDIKEVWVHFQSEVDPTTVNPDNQD